MSFAERIQEVERVAELRGVQTPQGQRACLVRVVTDWAGLERQHHKLLLVDPDGDWTEVGYVSATLAIAWLIGDEIDHER